MQRQTSRSPGEADEGAPARARAEVARLRWEEVDWEGGTRTQTTNKAGRLHAVPLAPEALAILRDLRDKTRERINEINELRVSRKGLERRSMSDFCFPADLVMNNCEPNSPIDGVLSRRIDEREANALDRRCPG